MSFICAKKGIKLQGDKVIKERQKGDNLNVVHKLGSNEFRIKRKKAQALWHIGTASLFYDVLWFNFLLATHMITSSI